MKTRNIIIIISIVLILLITMTTYVISKGQKVTNRKRKFVECTINKELTNIDSNCGFENIKIFYCLVANFSYKEIESSVNYTLLYCPCKYSEKDITT